MQDEKLDELFEEYEKIPRWRFIKRRRMMTRIIDYIWDDVFKKESD